ncbi:MAG: response regulator [Christensenellaceae bacterium]|jgi:two-component system response regulator YesN|nr:response regulator [Christensenellaceae bacterium]
MDIYKIMIVDDEADVREGIVRHIDWKKLGLSVVAEAENGQDALEKAEAQEIDIVLTDIKMPFMDGICMCEHLRELYPSIKIIFLTGFDEFDFAKAAIKLNAVEYILKPINVAELTEILRRVRALLDESNAQKRDMEALRQDYQNMLPLMRDRFLNELLWGIAPEDDLPARLAQHGIALGQSPYHVVAVFAVERAPGVDSAVARELAPISVKQLVEETLQGRCVYEAFLDSVSIVVITSWPNASPIAELMRLANEICLRSARVLGLLVTAGIGRPQSDLRDLHASHAGARASLEYKAAAGAGQAIYIGDMEQVTLDDAISFDSRSEQQLLSVIKFGTQEQLRRMLTGLLDQIDNSDAWERQAYLISVFNTVFRIVRRYKLHAENTVAEHMQMLLRAGDHWDDQEAMLNSLLQTCACIRDYISTQRATAAKTFVEEAKRYIGENYGDPTLSLERLCQRLHVSQTYFSAVFKQKTGMSYVQYLTETRLNRAVELLRETDEKTYIIAREVGYEEPNYFSYVFKKHYGLSPTQYRGK